MIEILSDFMNDPFGVEVTEVFETEMKVERTEEGVPFVSVNFFNTPRKEHPENNRTFTWEGIENQTDEEIINELKLKVPELWTK